MSDANAPWFYSIFVGQTREECIEVLGPDAFRLTAGAIMARLHAGGYKPDVLDPSREPLAAPGVTSRIIDDDGRVMLVSVDVDGDVISVQERVGEPYPDEKAPKGLAILVPVGTVKTARATMPTGWQIQRACNDLGLSLAQMATHLRVPQRRLRVEGDAEIILPRPALTTIHRILHKAGIALRDPDEAASQD